MRILLNPRRGCGVPDAVPNVKISPFTHKVNGRLESLASPIGAMSILRTKPEPNLWCSSENVPDLQSESSSATVLYFHYLLPFINILSIINIIMIIILWARFYGLLVLFVVLAHYLPSNLG